MFPPSRLRPEGNEFNFPESTAKVKSRTHPAHFNLDGYSLDFTARKADNMAKPRPG